MAACRPGPARAATVDTSRSVAPPPNRIVCRRALRAPKIGDDLRDFAGRRPWQRHKRGTPIELQLADGFVDVGQCPVGEPFGRLAVVDARVPAPAEFLDRADIDHPVVQKRVQVGHVAGDERPIGGDRIARQRCCLGLFDVLADVVEHHRLGGCQVDGGRLHLVGSAPSACAFR